MASSSSGTRSSEAVGACGCRRARSERVPARGRYMRFLGRNRSPLQGSDSPAHAAQRSGEHSGVDKTGEPRCAWLGPPLQAGPRPKALPPTRRLVGAANLVAPVRQMALLQLGNVATQQALRRVWARQSCRADPFHRHSEESVFVKAGCGKTARPVWAADGGQRESIERASSDPTAVKPANKAEQSAAELVEQRAETKGNANQQSACRTQSRVSVSQALERIRQAFAVWTRGKSRMRESCTYGSARGARDNSRPLYVADCLANRQIC